MDTLTKIINSIFEFFSEGVYVKVRDSRIAWKDVGIDLNNHEDGSIYIPRNW